MAELVETAIFSVFKIRKLTENFERVFFPISSSFERKDLSFFTFSTRYGKSVFLFKFTELMQGSFLFIIGDIFI